MSSLRELAQNTLSASRLEVGEQFTTEDIVALQATAAIKLVDVDYVQYDRKDRNPSDPDFHVSYSVWTVNVIDETGEIRTGFYRGGTSLNDLAVDIMGTDGMVDALREEGLFIKLKVKKTSKGQNFTQVMIV